MCLSMWCVQNDFNAQVFIYLDGQKKPTQALSHCFLTAYVLCKPVHFVAIGRQAFLAAILSGVRAVLT